MGCPNYQHRPIIPRSISSLARPAAPLLPEPPVYRNNYTAVPEPYRGIESPGRLNHVIQPVPEPESYLFMPPEDISAAPAPSYPSAIDTLNDLLQKEKERYINSPESNPAFWLNR